MIQRKKKSQRVLLIGVVCEQVSLARAIPVVYPLWLVIFSTLAAIPIAIFRVYSLGLGIISGLSFGIIVLLGESIWPAKMFWRMVCCDPPYNSADPGLHSSGN